jgi:hypothetical protein
MKKCHRSGEQPDFRGGIGGGGACGQCDGIGGGWVERMARVLGVLFPKHSPDSRPPLDGLRISGMIETSVLSSPSTSEGRKPILI